MRWRNREQTVKYKFCTIWNRNCAGEFEIPWSSPNFQCPSRLLSFLKVFSSSREWSFPTLLESLFSFRPFSFVQPDFILKNCWQKWENCSGKSRNLPLSPFTATYFLDWSWASLCFRPPSQVSSLRCLEDIWSCVSGSGYFWLEPLQVFF